MVCNRQYKPHGEYFSSFLELVDSSDPVTYLAQLKTDYKIHADVVKK
jgi:hypothetical protein